MTYSFFNYQIKSEKYGWITQKKAGSQWKESSFFRTLGQASKYVFEERLAMVTKADVIDLTNIQQAKQQIDRVIERIDCIRDEIMGVFNG